MDTTIGPDVEWLIENYITESSSLLPVMKDLRIAIFRADCQSCQHNM